VADADGSPRGFRFWLRAIAFIVVLCFMAGGPFYEQVLKRRDMRPFLPRWVMFAGTGLRVVDAEFRERGEDGRERVLDRFDVLGYQPPREAPSSVWRMKGQRGTWKVARRLCEALGEGTDVRVTSRYATRAGWERGYQGKANLCAAPEPPRRRKGR
jgi:hypothetical protein